MSKPLTTLGDLMMSRDPNWRAELRALEIPRRPSNAKDSRPDRGYVEQPEERAASEQKTFIRRREESPTLVAPVALIRPIVSDAPERVPDDRDVFPPPMGLTPPPPPPEPEPPQQTLVMLRRGRETLAATEPKPEKAKQTRERHSLAFKLAAVERLATSGETQIEISRALGLKTPSMLSQRARGKGLDRNVRGEKQTMTGKKTRTAGRKRRHPDAIKAMAVQRLDKGEPVDKIAAQYGVTTALVYKWRQRQRQAPGNGTPVVPQSAKTNGVAPAEAAPAEGSALDRLLESKLEKRLDSLIEAKLLQMLEKKLGA